MRVWNDRGVNWRMIVAVSEGPIPGGETRFSLACNLPAVGYDWRFVGSPTSTILHLRNNYDAGTPCVPQLLYIEADAVSIVD
jgi:hypothetical protein